MNALIAALLDLLFPPRCPFCHRLLRDGEEDLCAACQRELPWLQGGKAERNAEFLSVCLSPLSYGGQVREAVHRFKFRGRKGYAALFGRLMAQCVADHGAVDYDLVTWVPLSEKRLRERGYDQALLLARAMGETLGTEPVSTLRRLRSGGTQSRLRGVSARRANVLGLYELQSGAEVAGKKILLVDDVITTGATMSECARVLRTAGAERVTGVTLAQTGRKKEESGRQE